MIIVLNRIRALAFFALFWGAWFNAPIGGPLEGLSTSKKTALVLGLSICRKIIEAHGGQLTADNNPNRGATVRFTLPGSHHKEEKSA